MSKDLDKGLFFVRFYYPENAISSSGYIVFCLNCTITVSELFNKNDIGSGPVSRELRGELQKLPMVWRGLSQECGLMFKMQEDKWIDIQDARGLVDWCSRCKRTSGLIFKMQEDLWIDVQDARGQVDWYSRCKRTCGLMFKMQEDKFLYDKGALANKCWKRPLGTEV
jgi:hypothetical protein